MAVAHPPVDRGYQALLAQLARAQPTLPLDTIHGALCHYLIHLPATQPTPSPLTAAVTASLLYSSSNSQLQTFIALGSVYRTSLSQKWDALKKQEPERSLFDVSASSETGRWVRSVLNGLKGGDALICLAITGGLLHGLEFLDEVASKPSLKRRIEDIAILSYAEVIAETAENSNDPWSSEFTPKGKQRSQSSMSCLLTSCYSH